MKAYVVIEGATDARLIAKLLPDDLLQETEIVAASELSSLTSKARTLLAIHRKPVVAIRDADTVNQSAADQLYDDMNSLIRAVSAGLPYRVIVMVPETEVLLFEVPDAIERATGQQLSSEDRVQARFAPAEVITRLGGGQSKATVFFQVVDALTEAEVETLRQTSQIRELIEFLSEVVLAEPQTA